MSCIVQAETERFQAYVQAYAYQLEGFLFHLAQVCKRVLLGALPISQHRCCSCDRVACGS